MTSAFDVARTGKLDAERAELAWACTGCLRCREACDHRNPVTETLDDARADYVALGRGPASVLQLLERREQVEAEHAAAVTALRQQPGVSPTAETALLLGCRYARELPDVARDAIRLAVRLTGRPVRLLSGCCGAWQQAAGARNAAQASRERLAGELRDTGSRTARLLVLDPGCALPLRELDPLTLVELAARHIDQLSVASGQDKGLRYHDSCSLGRGLGLYEEPRRLLSAVLGEPALEFAFNRSAARCSGAGGLLPVSMPDVARTIAQRRRQEHEELGGGTIVTSCASSLSLFRKQGVPAADLITVLARGLVPDG